jgi:hypothetical protein
VFTAIMTRKTARYTSCTRGAVMETASLSVASKILTTGMICLYTSGLVAAAMMIFGPILLTLFVHQNVYPNNN